MRRLTWAGGYRVVGRRLWQPEAPHPEVVLFEFHFLAGGVHLHRVHLPAQTGDGDVVARPEVHVDEQSVALPREAGVVGAAHLADVSAVNRVAVGVHPLADLGQNAHRFFRHRPVRFRADVQQVVTALARATDQVPHYRLRAFPVVIGLVVAPTVIHRHAGFPGLVADRRNTLFGGGEIAFELIPIIYDDVRL